MKRALSLPTLLATLLLFLSSPPAGALTVTEVAGGQVVISAAQFGRPSIEGAFYNATGIKVGSELYLYVQGALFGGGPAGPGQELCPLDKILLFKAPWTTQGLTSTFQFVKRISDCTGDAYGVGEVLFDGSLYRIFLDRSDQLTFKTLMMGTSVDGINWQGSYQVIAESTSEVSMFAPVMKEGTAYCHSNGTFHCHTVLWGFFPFNTSTIKGTARMRIDIGPEFPRGFRVEIQSGSQWRAVDDLTGEFSFTPDDVWPNVSVKSLTPGGPGSTAVLWAWKNVPHAAAECAPCSGDYENGPAGTTFVRRTVDEFGAMYPVEAVDSNVRCMPSDSDVGRMFPFPIQGPDGKRYLYSATNDADICDLNDPNHFFGMDTVVTEIEP